MAPVYSRVVGNFGDRYVYDWIESLSSRLRDRIGADDIIRPPPPQIPTPFHLGSPVSIFTSVKPAPTSSSYLVPNASIKTPVPPVLGKPVPGNHGSSEQRLGLGNSDTSKASSGSSKVIPGVQMRGTFTEKYEGSDVSLVLLSDFKDAMKIKNVLETDTPINPRTPVETKSAVDTKASLAIRAPVIDKFTVMIGVPAEAKDSVETRATTETKVPVETKTLVEVIEAQPAEVPVKKKKARKNRGTRGHLRGRKHRKNQAGKDPEPVQESPELLEADTESTEQTQAIVLGLLQEKNIEPIGENSIGLTQHVDAVVPELVQEQNLVLVEETGPEPFEQEAPAPVKENWFVPIISRSSSAPPEIGRQTTRDAAWVEQESTINPSQFISTNRQPLTPAKEAEAKARLAARKKASRRRFKDRKRYKNQREKKRLALKNSSNISQANISDLDFSYTDIFYSSFEDAAFVDPASSNFSSTMWPFKAGIPAGVLRYNGQDWFPCASRVPLTVAMTVNMEGMEKETRTQRTGPCIVNTEKWSVRAPALATQRAVEEEATPQSHEESEMNWAQWKELNLSGSAQYPREGNREQREHQPVRPSRASELDRERICGFYADCCNHHHNKICCGSQHRLTGEGCCCIHDRHSCCQCVVHGWYERKEDRSGDKGRTADEQTRVVELDMHLTSPSTLNLSCRADVPGSDEADLKTLLAECARPPFSLTHKYSASLPARFSPSPASTKRYHALSDVDMSPHRAYSDVSRGSFDMPVSEDLSPSVASLFELSRRISHQASSSTSSDRSTVNRPSMPQTSQSQFPVPLVISSNDSSTSIYPTSGELEFHQPHASGSLAEEALRSPSLYFDAKSKLTMDSQEVSRETSPPTQPHSEHAFSHRASSSEVPTFIDTTDLGHLGHLRGLFNQREFSDIKVILSPMMPALSPDKRLPASEVFYLHKAILAKSPFLYAIMNAKRMRDNEVNEIHALTGMAFKSSHAFAMALKTLYGSPIVTPDTLREVTLAGLNLPSTNATGEYEFPIAHAQVDFALCYAASGAFLARSDITERGIHMALNLLSWETAEFILHFGMVASSYVVTSPEVPFGPTSTRSSRSSSYSDTNNAPEITPAIRIDHIHEFQIHWAETVFNAALQFITAVITPDFELYAEADPTYAPNRVPPPLWTLPGSMLSNRLLEKIQFGSMPSLEQRRPTDPAITVPSAFLLALPYGVLAAGVDLINSNGTLPTLLLIRVIEEREKRRLHALRILVAYKREVPADALHELGYRESVMVERDGEDERAVLTRVWDDPEALRPRC
ncbi:hypothetical protein N7462_011377 [Penicillium macrosclerotiorum]|uniref:uncharacterized protein n=1 Tax=Penicillium macrosclerotiorum TaxID=303699 RepID=UPI002548E902|nr:uncharacterized protein N7462_011377 [Penicillium macrosclerotiorum]KAJ5666968.1 hypothetical protein N7462_011377 [Penicillium macrosclerotiorum]